MMRTGNVDHPLRGRLRLTALLLCAATLCAATLCAPVASAANQSQSQANSTWLARQLAPDGTLSNPFGGALPDHGLMIDTLFALYASGDGKLAKPTADYLDKHATDFFTWDALVPGQGYDAIITGGAAAKVLVAAEVAGRDPRTSGEHDMVAKTQGTIMRDGRDKGRVS